MAVESRTAKSRAVPLLILLLFLAPMVSAWVIYKYFPDAVRTLGTKNFGTFVSPVVPLSMDGLRGLDGKVIDASYFRDKWTYVYLGADGCDDTCRSNLLLTRQVRLAQGGEADRVQRLFVADKPDASVEAVAKQFPSLRVAVTSNSPAFRAQFRHPHGAAGPKRIYLVDPLGQLMMFYDVGPNPLDTGTGMRKDLERLLRNSKVG